MAFTWTFPILQSATQTGSGNSLKVTPTSPATDLTGTGSVKVTESITGTSLAIGEAVTVVYGSPSTTLNLFFRGDDLGGPNDGNILAYSTSATGTGGTWYITNVNNTLVTSQVNISDNKPWSCFLPGTLISTVDGFRPVEALSVGDLVLTDHGPQPVRFVSCNTGHPLTLLWSGTLPVRISAHAFGESGPTRDLLVTPGHAVLVDGHLVHASALVNGSTIVQTTIEDWYDHQQISCYNIELETHRLIWAEGLQVESYFDILPRKFWDNYGEYMALYGEDLPMEELPLPRVEFTRQLPISLIHSLGSDIRHPVAV